MKDEAEVILILPESKEAYAELFDANMLWMVLRHLQTVCETAQINELSISNGTEMLTATFTKLRHKVPQEPMGIFIRQCGSA